jgi:hypothetical protein
MPRKTVFFFLFFLSLSSYKAQWTSHSMGYAGYSYQNQNFGEVGLRFLFLKNDDFAFRIGGGAGFGNVNGSWTAIPKIQTDFLLNSEKEVDIRHSYYYLLGAEFSTKSISPKVGISLFGLLDCTAGYAFSVDKNGSNGKEMQGINFNLTFNIPWVVFSK